MNSVGLTNGIGWNDNKCKRALEESEEYCREIERQAERKQQALEERARREIEA